MKLLVTGARGQVGWELARSLQPLGEVIALDRQRADLGDPAALRSIVEEIRPQVIVNAAAYTAVDKAEQDQAAAQTINAQAPSILAEQAARSGALLLHYSTDYVFDGSKSRPYSEDDAPNPLNVYGRTKLEGERAIAALGRDWLVLRTSWVYSARGGNFPRTMLRLAQERDKLSVVNDQVGAPTSSRFIADATAQIVFRALAERKAGQFASGVFHLTSAGETSWHGLAEAVIGGARERGAPIRIQQIAGIPGSQYPTPARRPMNSRLDLARVQSRFGVTPPDWRTGIELLLDELLL